MKLEIVQLNDGHDPLSEHWEGRWRGGELELFRAGGYDRVADFVRERRQTGHPVLFFVDGDSLHGTGPVVNSPGMLPLAVFARLGLDGFVPASTGSSLLRRVRPRQLGFRLRGRDDQGVGGRLGRSGHHRQRDGGGDERAAFSPTAMFDAGGLAVGLIGLSYPHEAAS
ncbi:MAG: hypothetical protein KM312_11585, partial [Hydrogenibacillus schlegelii]|nr:hypothetical protein [Hydrogenibacillus schlegelii]